MKHRYSVVFCLSALACCAAALCALAAPRGRGPGQDARVGRITAIEKRSGDVRLATVALEGEAAAQPGVTVYGAESMRVLAGMEVRLDVMLGTAIFSLPVGRVVEVQKDGKGCVFMVDEGSLDAEMEDPSTQKMVKLRGYFQVGASVAISR